AAYAGIPLTHRDHAHRVTFVTGHGEETGTEAAGAGPAGAEPDWASLARPGATVVFYMGLARLEHIVARLMENGAPAGRPAALIAQGTTAEQQVVAATLGTIGTEVTARRIESPALLVIGEVAALHASLAWFGQGPTAESASQSA
ncbi:MAG TPA: SAM-dependent methyltransferase, partial [Steroidobacteraceae bacterium]